MSKDLVKALLELATLEGIDVAPVRQLLEQERVPRSQYTQFWHHLEAHASSPVWLEMAANITAGRFGIVDYWSRASKTLGEVLEELRKLMHLLNDFRLIELDVVAGNAVWSYVDHASPISATEWSLATHHTAFGQLCDQWLPLAVRFPHRPTSPLEVFHDFFGCTVQFDMPDAAIVFPAQLLDSPIDSDPFLRGVLEPALRQAEDALPNEQTFVGQVRALIETELAKKTATRDAVATQLAMSPRTLQRRLVDLGVESFSGLREEVRRAAAERMLSGSDESIGNIALRLGYANESNFNRAFHRWNGVAPSIFRRSRGR